MFLLNRHLNPIVSNIIYGPDGKPLVGSSEAWLDKTQTYSKDGEQYSAKPHDILVAAARMQRDGMSLKNIRAELDLADAVTDRELQRALNIGHELLKRRIKAGKEHEESKVRIDPLDAPLKAKNDIIEGN